MSAISDHSIVKTLKDGNLRNDPEVLDFICDFLIGLDLDIDKVGELVLSRSTDTALESLAAAIVRSEDEREEEDNEDEDENEDEELDEEDEEDDEEEEEL